MGREREEYSTSETEGMIKGREGGRQRTAWTGEQKSSEKDLLSKDLKAQGKSSRQAEGTGVSIRHRPGKVVGKGRKTLAQMFTCEVRPPGKEGEWKKKVSRKA